MKFEDKLLTGLLIRRYKRFFVDIKYKNKIITAHCPNPGSMMGLLDKNNVVWFSKSKNPLRKLKYTLELIQVNKTLVGVNTLRANKLVLEGLNKNKIKSLKKYNVIRSEKKFSRNTRFDFLISNKNEECFLEVKNVTLMRKNNTAEFPDSITSRGKKHLLELVKAQDRGFKSYILFLIQRTDSLTFKIADDIDEKYKFAFDRALKLGVKMLCYDCKINSKEILLNKQINII